MNAQAGSGFLPAETRVGKWFSGPLQFRLKVVSPLRKLKLKVACRLQKLKLQESLANRRPSPKWLLPLEAQTESGFSPAQAQATRVVSPIDAPSPKWFSYAELQVARIHSSADVQTKAFSRPITSPQRRNASSLAFANDSKKTVGAYIFRLEPFGTGSTASRSSRARTRPAATDARPPASKSPRHQEGRHLVECRSVKGH